MKKSFLGAISSLLASAGMAFAQAPAAELPANGQTPDAVPVAASPADAPGDLAGDGDAAASNRLWFSAGYLLWWFKKSPEPVPLVTTTSVATAQAQSAAHVPLARLGAPGTSVVLGGQPIDTEEHSGGRFTAGYWLDSDRTFGVEGTYLFLAPRSVSQSVSSDGSPGAPVLVVPFFDVAGATTGGAGGFTAGPAGESSIPFVIFPFAFPGLVTGGETLTVRTSFQGAELNGVVNLYTSGGLRLEALAGFRWAQLSEDFAFTTSSTVIQPGILLGSFYNTLDGFNTRNDFYSGQVGARAEYGMGKLFVNATGKVALGDMHETVDINGNTQTNFLPALLPGGHPGPSQTFLGGVFAQPSNIGHHTGDRFAVMPEVDVNVGYQLADWARVSVGYSFLYLSDVARPGNQIDRNLNPTTTGFAAAARAIGATGIPAVTGPAAPTFDFHDSSFWAQGINFGLEFRY